MILRYWLIMLMMTICVYGSLGVLLDSHMRFRFTEEYWRYYVFVCAPYCLAMMSALSWHRCYVWRRMMHSKQAPFNYITRGIVDIYYSKEKTSFLENLCSMLVLFGIAGILHHWSVAHIMRWLSAIIVLWFVLGLLFRKSRTTTQNTDHFIMFLCVSSLSSGMYLSDLWRGWL